MPDAEMKVPATQIIKASPTLPVMERMVLGVATIEALLEQWPLALLGFLRRTNSGSNHTVEDEEDGTPDTDVPPAVCGLVIVAVFDVAGHCKREITV